MRLVLFPNSSDQRTAEVDTTVTIGRAEGNGLVIHSEALADYHARLERREDGWAITDLAGRGDVCVDDQPVRSAPLSLGARVRLGPVDMLVIALERQDTDVLRVAPVIETSLVESVAHTARLCPDCGGPLQEGVRFCPHCGSGAQSGGAYSVRGAVLARIALICALCGPLLLGIGWLLGGILGIVAVLRTRRLGFGRADRRAAWWAVVISLLWVALIGAGAAAYGWRHLAAVRVRWNEDNAEKLMRNVALAQFYVKYAELYDADQDGTGEFVDFGKLARANYHVFDHDLAANPLYHGYYFSMKRADEQGFICTAVPWRYGLDGRRSFWIDERGVLYQADLKGAPFDRSPASMSEQDMRESLLVNAAEEFAGDLAQAAETAFKKGDVARCKRIIETVRRLFPATAAAQRLTTLEQTTDPFLMEFKARELVQRAQDMRSQNLHDQAIELLRTVLRQFPASASAAQAMQQITTLTETQARQAIEQAEMLLATNQAEQALAIMQDIGRRYPEAVAVTALKDRIAQCEMDIMKQLERTASALAAEARTHETAGDFEAAYNLYLTVKNRYGKTSAATGIDDLLDKSRRMIEEQEATRLTDEILALQPETDAARILALVDLLKRGYARTENYKKNERTLLALQQTCRAQTYLASARQQLQDKSYRAALANLELAIAEAPSLAISMDAQLRECYLRLGDSAYENQEYIQALDYYQSYLKLQSTNVQVNAQRLMECSFQVAKIKLQQRDFNDAEKHLIACSSQYGKDPEYNLTYGRVLMNLERWDEAVQRLATALSISSPYTREARLYWVYCQARLAMYEEDVLRTMLADDEDLSRLMRDYGVVFYDTGRTNFVLPLPPAKPKSPVAKPFAELTLEMCGNLDALASEAERLTQLDRSRSDQLLAQRTKVRALAQDLPSQLSVLRASISADSYRKGKIMEQLRKLRRQVQALNTALNAMQERSRAQEYLRLSSAAATKLAALRKGEESLEQYIGLEEQRRRTVISIVETLVSTLRSATPNASILKSRADDLRTMYASSKETDLAVDGLRALSEAYQILPDVMPLLLTDPSATERSRSTEAAR